MIAHRMQTHFSPEPPVKIYRIIALSFLFVTIVLLSIVIFTMLKKTEITIVAKEDNKTINLIVTAEANKRGDKSLPAMVTTTEFFWSGTYTPTATRDVEGTATGEVIIYNKLNESQTLVATTRLLSPDNVLFRLKDRVIVPANGQITAQVYADAAGAGSDIGPTQFIIPGLNQERQKFIYAESKKPMAGGSGKVGIVSESDYKSAESDYQEKIKEAFVKTFNESYPGLDQKIIEIKKLNATSTHKIGEQAGQFSLYGTSTIAVIMYNSNDLVEIIKKEVNSQIDSGTEKILSLSENPKVSVATQDQSNDSIQLQVVTSAIVTLDANAPLLNKEYFLNKQKGEIERYIVSLPHVTGMTIKFSPSWTSKTPAVGDKIKIVVKSVK